MSEHVELRVLREGDGHRYVRSFQWHLSCPHMGAAERILYMRLSCLVSDDRPVRKLTLSEIAQGLHKGPVAPGETPKPMSISGAVRLLNGLGRVGQVSAPDGTPLRVSNGKAANLRIAVAMYPRHACNAARTVYDDLARIRGEEMRYPDCSGDQQKSVGALEDQQNPVVSQHNPGDDQQNSAGNHGLTCENTTLYSSFHSSYNNRARGDVAARTEPSKEAPAALEEDDASLKSKTDPAGAVGKAEVTISPEAETVIDSLPWGGKQPGLKSRQQLAVAISQALAEGWTSTSLTSRLKGNWGPQVRYPVSFVLSQLTDLPRPVMQQAGGMPPWCGSCGDPYVFQKSYHPSTHAGLRVAAPDFVRKCPACHPALAAKSEGAAA